MTSRMFKAITITAAAVMLLTPRVSLANKKVSGDITAQFMSTKNYGATVSKLRQYSTLPDQFSLDSMHLLYNSNKDLARFCLSSPGNDDSMGRLSLIHKRDWAFSFTQESTPHSINVIGGMPIETVRTDIDWTLKLFPASRNRLTVSYDVNDKVGRLDATAPGDLALGLYDFKGVGQKNETLSFDASTKIMNAYVSANISNRDFNHISAGAEQDTIGITVTSDPAKKHYAELAYETSDLSPANGSAATSTVELTKLDIYLSGMVSNRMQVGAAYSVDERENENAAYFGSKHKDLQLLSDYSAGSLDVSMSYNKRESDLSGTKLYNPVQPPLATYVDAAAVRSLDTETLGLGLDYRYSIFKLKYNYKHSYRDSDAPGGNYEDVDFTKLPSEGRDTNFTLSTRGLKAFGLTYFRREKSDKNVVSSTYGLENTKLKAHGMTSYYMYSPALTLTLSLFDSEYGASGTTKNSPGVGISELLSLGMFQYNRMYSLGANIVLDESSTLVLSTGRSKAGWLNRTGDNDIFGRNYSASISRKLDKLTSVSASFTANRYDERVPSAYDGSTRHFAIKATRKF